jgi:hypothetical protein
MLELASPLISWGHVQAWRGDLEADGFPPVSKEDLLEN